MFRGVTFALGACFIWGLVFVVPQFLTSCSSSGLNLGCYLCCGIVAALLLVKFHVRRHCRYSLTLWRKAIHFSFVSNIFYYSALVFALRYATPSISALIIGICPIATTFYGNWKEKEYSFKKFILPSISILIGLLLINAPQLSQNSETPFSLLYPVGLTCAFLAMMSWSWYVVSNARFLKQNVTVSSSEWSTMLGVTTLLWLAIFYITLNLFFFEGSHLQKSLNFSTELQTYFLVSTTLGLLFSWVGSYLWNEASVTLPISLAGQLTIFETVFGLVFVGAVEQRWPPLLECGGIALILTAIIYGIRGGTKSYTTLSDETAPTATEIAECQV